MTLEDRVLRLEREACRWRRIAIVLALTLGTSLYYLGSGATPTNSLLAATEVAPIEKVRTKSLEIVDEDGHIRFIMAGKGATGGMAFYDGAGRNRGGIVVPDNGNTMLVLQPQDGSKQVMLTTAAIGGQIYASAPNGKGGAHVGANELGGGFLSILNPNGKSVVDAQSDKGNCGLVGVCDFNGDFKNGLFGR